MQTRRGFLASTAAVATTAALVGIPILAHSQSPDAELLALGAEYESLLATSYDHPGEDGMPEEMWERFYEIEDRISVLEPKTLEGVAVQLRLVWCWHANSGVEHRYGAQRDSDDRTKLFWGVIQTVRGMGATA
ncbi:hypothetical protein [Pararhodospirillum photometricum]|nr:hypothetical protein [Pararhodospirillum photometricum]